VAIRHGGTGREGDAHCLQFSVDCLLRSFMISPWFCSAFVNRMSGFMDFNGVLRLTGHGLMGRPVDEVSSGIGTPCSF
jgi:hypothetical protein